VVDALNLAGGDPARVEAAIDGAAPRLKLRHPGRVMFVVKDGEGALATPARRAALQAAAARNGVYVYAAERYADPPAGSASSRAAAAAGVHSARGRDDFLAAVLAFRWRCPVLTEDRFRDFAEFRATVRPFHVFEFAFWRATPARDFVDPASAAFARLRRPRGVRPAAYGLGPAGAPLRGPGKGQKAAPQIEPPEPPLKRQTLP
jgi:hypothetical protein